MTQRRGAEEDPANRGAPAEREPASDQARTDAPTLGSTAGIPDEAEGERPARDLTGRLRLGAQVVAALLSLYALYNVFVPFTVLPYRIIFLAVVLPLTFLLYRPALSILRRREATHDADTGGEDTGGDASDGEDNNGEPSKEPGRLDRPTLWDWLLAGLSIFVTLWPLIGGFDAYLARSFAPFYIDVICGFAVVVLVLLATWRTVGPILPIIVAVFILYAYFGYLIPDGWLIGHRGYGLSRLTSQFVMGTEGIFGVPLDVAATYIILFTIYGAVLELSGAGQFFLDISLAAFRKSRTAPGRTVTMAGFLLGTVSGSSTATTVSLGSVAWPILQRAGYPREAGGGVLAAAGIGAILSPPTLGAAAFIIAELLRVSYLEVLGYALIPTLLYYLGIFLAIEFDARRFGVKEVEIPQQGFWKLLGRFGYHFSSLVVIVILLALGQSAFKAVVYATVLAFLLSFLDKRHRMTPPKVFAALAKGSLGVLPVAATCAAAGLIVAVLTITGLGLDLSGIIVDLADVLSSNPTMMLVLTTFFAAIAVILLGLAVPVTASFIIAAVIIAPALTALGVGTPEAYMFIFYYAVLSEVSPPTALAAVAAAAITGGNATKTMLATWKYTLPAFLVPFAFVLAPAGAGLIADAPVLQTLLVTLISGVAVAALAVVVGKWMFGPGRSDRASPVSGRRTCAALPRDNRRAHRPWLFGCGRRRTSLDAKVPCRNDFRFRHTIPSGGITMRGLIMRRRPSFAVAALAAGALVLAGCTEAGGGGGGGGGDADSDEPGCAAPAESGRLSIATGNTTGVYYILGGGIAQVLTDNVEGIEATAEATNASAENIRFVCAGDSDIGFTLADTAADAVNGTASFEDAAQPVQALARIYSNYTQVFVRSDAGIDSIADMAGKRISTGSPNSGTEVIALRLLEANDLTADDIEQQSLGLPESVQGMKDGTIDGLIWSGGLPTGGITDLVTSLHNDVKALPLTEELATLQDTYGEAYMEGAIPTDAYGLDEEIATIVVPNLLVVSDAMSEDLAYEITKAIFENLDTLASVHPEAENISLETATETAPVELHPGAQRYFDEQ